MLSQSMWWGCILLEICLLFRGFRGKALPQYPVFYSYISFVLVQDLLRFIVYHWDSQFYSYTYWATEFLGVLIGCAVVFEVVKIGLSAFPGTARMARNLLALVFVLASTKAIADASNDPSWWLSATTMNVERALRAVQALAILGLVALFLYYAISFGRNLRGILLGYGFFLSINLIQLTLAVPGSTRFQSFWYRTYPVSYFALLLFWVAHLWSYQPSPAPKASVLLEQQYEAVAAATHRRLQEARAYIGKAVRP